MELYVLGGVLTVGGTVAAGYFIRKKLVEGEGAEVPSKTHPAVVAANGDDAQPGTVLEAGPGDQRFV